MWWLEHDFWYIFPYDLGVSSSQLTNWVQATNQTMFADHIRVKASVFVISYGSTQHGDIDFDRRNLTSPLPIHRVGGPAWAHLPWTVQSSTRHSPSPSGGTLRCGLLLLETMIPDIFIFYLIVSYCIILSCSMLGGASKKTRKNNWMWTHMDISEGGQT